ncbi:TlpA family protein disulfide reductase [Amycolatopsis saalfeldensis]|uniref:Thiol-disulfide isomerase or thioredoxin n=1 Tax=Amycolatopsis saalfeldensis TaxID=394193 RepID=A0A1H8YPP5_9PSEU|nr:TlpA disulfide reductase family protein [Amycolatopsis saalfeldensis]SEP53338.1 Thiol-disulfide isomerase or thioredoxin [Amycolatopsis saalfeldensis]
MRRTRWPGVALAVAGLLTLTACSSGTDAVARGSTFEFVSPGGQTTIFYDPSTSRGTAPDLSGESLPKPGTQIRLSDYAGKVVVINIWGSWCGPCRAETPELEKVFEQTQSSGVQFLGIDVRDDRAAAEDFVRDRHVTYPSIFDPSGRSLLALNGYPRSVVPSTLVLDRRHRVAAVFLTALIASDLLPVVQRVAAEPTPPQGRPA